MERAALAALGKGARCADWSLLPGLRRNDPSEGESSVEIFGVVADPKTGSAVRVYQCVAPRRIGADGFANLDAEKLMEADTALLATASEGAR